MSAKPYNFRKPDRPAGSLEQRLSAWLRAAGLLAADKGTALLPFRIEMTLRGIEALAPGEALARLPDAVAAFRLAFAGESPSMLLVWPRPLALALVNGALGDTPAELPADRELTLVELSLCEYLMQSLAVAVLQETWSGATALTLVLEERDPSPRWTRLFLKAERILQCTFALRGPFGEQDWLWLLPYQAMHERIIRAEAAAQALTRQDAPRKLEALVRELPVELTIELGAAELPIAQLAVLTAGDLLILNQRVGEPLNVRVDSRAKFRGWPGRVGARQSLQIESLRE